MNVDITLNPRTRYAARSLAHSLLCHWASVRATDSMAGNPLYYPSVTIEGRMQRDGGLVVGGRSGSRSPDNRQDAEYSRITYIIQSMPRPLAEIVVHRYINQGMEGQKIQAWITETGLSYRTWYNRVDQLYDYIVGQYPIPIRSGKTDKLHGCAIKEARV